MRNSITSEVTRTVWADGEVFCAVGFIDKIDVGKIYFFGGWRRILKKILAVLSIA